MGSRGVMELGREQDSSEDELDALGDGASSASGASAADAAKQAAGMLSNSSQRLNTSKTKDSKESYLRKKREENVGRRFVRRLANGSFVIGQVQEISFDTAMRVVASIKWENSNEVTREPLKAIKAQLAPPDNNWPVPAQSKTQEQNLPLNSDDGIRRAAGFHPEASASVSRVSPNGPVRMESREAMTDQLTARFSRQQQMTKHEQKVAKRMSNEDSVRDRKAEYVGKRFMKRVPPDGYRVGQVVDVFREEGTKKLMAIVMWEGDKDTTIQTVDSVRRLLQSTTTEKRFERWGNDESRRQIFGEEDRSRSSRAIAPHPPPQESHQPPNNDLQYYTAIESEDKFYEGTCNIEALLDARRHEYVGRILVKKAVPDKIYVGKVHDVFQASDGKFMSTVMWNGEAQLSVQTFESVRKLVRCTEQEKRLERWVNTPPSEIVEDGTVGGKAASCPKKLDVAREQFREQHRSSCVGQRFVMKTQIGTLRVGEVLDVLYVNGNKLKATVQWEDNHEIILRPVEHVLNLIAITKQQHRLFWLKPEVSWPEGTGPNSIPPDNDEQDNDEDDETTDQYVETGIKKLCEHASRQHVMVKGMKHESVIGKRIVKRRGKATVQSGIITRIFEDHDGKSKAIVDWDGSGESVHSLAAVRRLLSLTEEERRIERFIQSPDSMMYESDDSEYESEAEVKDTGLNEAKRTRGIASGRDGSDLKACLACKQGGLTPYICRVRMSHTGPDWDKETLTGGSDCGAFDDLASVASDMGTKQKYLGRKFVKIKRGGTFVVGTVLDLFQDHSREVPKKWVVVVGYEDGTKAETSMDALLRLLRATEKENRFQLVYKPKTPTASESVAASGVANNDVDESLPEMSTKSEILCGANTLYERSSAMDPPENSERYADVIGKRFVKYQRAGDPLIGTVIAVMPRSKNDRKPMCEVQFESGVRETTSLEAAKKLVKMTRVENRFEQISTTLPSTDVEERGKRKKQISRPNLSLRNFASPNSTLQWSLHKGVLYIPSNWQYQACVFCHAQRIGVFQCRIMKGHKTANWLEPESADTQIPEEIRLQIKQEYLQVIQASQSCELDDRADEQVWTQDGNRPRKRTKRMSIHSDDEEVIHDSLPLKMLLSTSCVNAGDSVELLVGSEQKAVGELLPEGAIRFNDKLYSTISLFVRALDKENQLFSGDVSDISLRIGDRSLAEVISEFNSKKQRQSDTLQKTRALPSRVQTAPRKGTKRTEVLDLDVFSEDVRATLEAFPEMDFDGEGETLDAKNERLRKWLARLEASDPSGTLESKTALLREQLTAHLQRRIDEAGGFPGLQYAELEVLRMCDIENARTKANKVLEEFHGPAFQVQSSKEPAVESQVSNEIMPSIRLVARITDTEVQAREIRNTGEQLGDKRTLRETRRLNESEAINFKCVQRLQHLEQEERTVSSTFEEEKKRRKAQFKSYGEEEERLAIELARVRARLLEERTAMENSKQHFETERRRLKEERLAVLEQQAIAKRRLERAQTNLDTLEKFVKYVSSLPDNARLASGIVHHIKGVVDRMAQALNSSAKNDQQMRSMRMLYEALRLIRRCCASDPDIELLQPLMDKCSIAFVACPDTVSLADKSESAMGDVLVMFDTRVFMHQVPRIFPERVCRILKILKRTQKLAVEMSAKQAHVPPRAEMGYQDSSANLIADTADSCTKAKEVTSGRPSGVHLLLFNDQQHLPEPEVFRECVQLAHSQEYLDYLYKRAGLAAAGSAFAHLKDNAIYHASDSEEENAQQKHKAVGEDEPRQDRKKRNARLSRVFWNSLRIVMGLSAEEKARIESLPAPDPNDRVVLWDVLRERKITGHSSPTLKTIKEHLRRNPHLAVYTGQDDKVVPNECIRIAWELQKIFADSEPTELSEETDGEQWQDQNVAQCSPNDEQTQPCKMRKPNLKKPPHQQQEPQLQELPQYLEHTEQQCSSSSSSSQFQDDTWQALKPFSGASVRVRECTGKRFLQGRLTWDENGEKPGVRLQDGSIVSFYQFEYKAGRRDRNPKKKVQIQLPAYGWTTICNVQSALQTGTVAVDAEGTLSSGPGSPADSFLNAARTSQEQDEQGSAGYHDDGSFNEDDGSVANDSMEWSEAPEDDTCEYQADGDFRSPDTADDNTVETDDASVSKLSEDAHQRTERVPQPPIQSQPQHQPRQHEGMPLVNADQSPIMSQFTSLFGWRGGVLIGPDGQSQSTAVLPTLQKLHSHSNGMQDQPSSEMQSSERLLEVQHSQISMATQMGGVHPFAHTLAAGDRAHQVPGDKRECAPGDPYILPKPKMYKRDFELIESEQAPVATPSRSQPPNVVATASDAGCETNVGRGKGQTHTIQDTVRTLARKRPLTALCQDNPEHVLKRNRSSASLSQDEPSTQVSADDIFSQARTLFQSSQRVARGKEKVDKSCVVTPMMREEESVGTGPGWWEELEFATSDTVISAKSVEAAMAAATLVCHGVTAVMTGKIPHLSQQQQQIEGVEECIQEKAPAAANVVKNVFCVTRPPGHHAGRYGNTRGCSQNGFCLLNNVAIGAFFARVQYGLKRVAVVDIDAHFGNGTAEMFEGDDEAFYASVHLQYEKPSFFFPSSKSSVLGTDRITRNQVFTNVYPKLRWGHPFGSAQELLRGRKGFRTALSERILPALEAFNPQIIFISAGFDGYEGDPLGSCLGLKPEDFDWATKEILKVADRVCVGRVVSVLEGGYDISNATDGLARCAEAHVHGLAGAPFNPVVSASSPSALPKGS